MKTRKIIFRIFQNVIACVVSLVVLIPLAVIVLNSFKTQAESYNLDFSLPHTMIFSNYSTVIDRGNLVMSFFNSFIYASVSTILLAVVTTLAAFVLMRNKSRLNRFIYYFIILGISLSINYITLMKIMITLNLMNTRIGIILLYAATGIPFGIFLASGFIDTIPKELDEAAIIDGATPITLFTKVIFPLLKPVTATLFVLNFLGIWNDFTLAIYFLNSSKAMPMTLAVYNFFGQFSRSWNLVCADIVLTTIPVLIVYILGQKYIVSGMTTGAVKG
jgi:raffinose/stachyose/melibiose transport system permease protein